MQSYKVLLHLSEYGVNQDLSELNRLDESRSQIILQTFLENSRTRQRGKEVVDFLWI
jgi:hypothetical protein